MRANKKLPAKPKGTDNSMTMGVKILSYNAQRMR